jgi:hypothetical protein
MRNTTNATRARTSVERASANLTLERSNTVPDLSNRSEQVRTRAGTGALSHSHEGSLCRRHECAVRTKERRAGGKEPQTTAFERDLEPEEREPGTSEPERKMEEP